MNYRIKEPKQVVLHASGSSGAGFIDGVWHGQPQKKEWVGLTDDDYEELLRTRDWGVYLIEAVEAKLKEKNGG